MKRLKITVNGVPYDVQVEEMNGAASMPVVSAPVSAPVAAPAPVVSAPAPAPTPAPVVSAPADAETVSSPMPGTILDIKASVGDTVKKGDAIVVLEAMKMENDICAPKDGVVASISIGKGDSVESGTVLFSIS